MQGTLIKTALDGISTRWTPKKKPVAEASLRLRWILLTCPTSWITKRVRLSNRLDAHTGTAGGGGPKMWTPIILVIGDPSGMMRTTNPILATSVIVQVKVISALNTPGTRFFSTC